MENCSRNTYDFMSSLFISDLDLTYVQAKRKNRLMLELQYSKDYFTELYPLNIAEEHLISEINEQYEHNPKKKFFPRLIYKNIILDEHFNKTINMKNKTSLDNHEIAVTNSFKENIISPVNKSSSPAIHYKRYKEDNEEKIKDSINLNCDFRDNIKEISSNNLIDNQNSNFLDFLKFDLKRKVKWQEISFDDSVHDIYNPKFNSSHESNSKQDNHINFSSINKTNDENHTNSMNIILSSSELQGLQYQNNNINNNSLNIKQDYILVNPMDEKGVSSSKNIKTKNPLIFSSNDFANYNYVKKNTNIKLQNKAINKNKNKYTNLIGKTNYTQKINKTPQSFLTKTHSTSFKETIGKIKKTNNHQNSIEINKLKDFIAFEKDSEIILNMSGNNNHLNLSSNIFNDNNKNFLCTSTENFPSKYKDKPAFLQSRIKTPINLLSSSDKLLKDNIYTSSVGFQSKKSEPFNNKSELLTIRSINEIISVII